MRQRNELWVVGAFQTKMAFVIVVQRQNF